MKATTQLVGLRTTTHSCALPARECLGFDEVDKGFGALGLDGAGVFKCSAVEILEVATESSSASASAKEEIETK
jgi:hypothetical protein